MIPAFRHEQEPVPHLRPAQGSPGAGAPVAVERRVARQASVQVLGPGMRVVLRPSRANDIVAMKVYLPMGPFHEAPEEAGLSNLLQEMLLHGTLRRSEDELQDALADIGAKLGTSSAADYGSLTLRVERQQLAAALDLLDEVVTEPALAEEELAKEKIRVLNRIKAQHDSLLTAAFELFRETFYGEHPYHKPVLGYPETVRAATIEALRRARARSYQAGRLVVSAVGNFDPEDLLGRLARIVLPNTDGIPPERAPGAIRLEESRETLKQRESQGAWFVLGFPAPSFLDAGYPAARVLDAVLGGGMNSRLFMELREKRGLAYQVSSFYNDQLSHSFLAGYIGTSPGKLGEARAAMLAEFRKLAEERIPAAELNRAKKYIRGTYIISAETNAAQASRFGKYELYRLGQDFGDRFLERVDAVTAEEIRDVAQGYFVHHVLAAIQPDEVSGAGESNKREEERADEPA
jgi:zinc protease